MTTTVFHTSKSTEFTHLSGGNYTINSILVVPTYDRNFTSSLITMFVESGSDKFYLTSNFQFLKTENILLDTKLKITDSQTLKSVSTSSGDYSIIISHAT